MLFDRVRKLSSLASDATSKLNVLGHDCDSLGMDGCQVGVLKQADQVSLSCLLESQNSAGLESQVSLEVLCNLTDKPLERQLPDQELCGLLVLPDLTQSHCSWPVSAINNTRVRLSKVHYSKWCQYRGSKSGRKFANVKLLSLLMSLLIWDDNRDGLQCTRHLY